MSLRAERWMRSAGMTVKSEFITPWGICDLVGLSFNAERVAHRLQLKQTKAIGSITRAFLLLQIPDVETKATTTIDRLVRCLSPSIPPDSIADETSRLVADRFVVRTHRGRLQKLNGWLPLQDRLVAVELKLTRVDEAMHQALNNLGFAQESFVGLPSDVAHRVASHSLRWSRFFNEGIGLLSIGRRRCSVLIPPRKPGRWADKAIQLYSVEKFWRTRIKDS